MQFCRSRAGGNPVKSRRWISAFAEMTIKSALSWLCHSRKGASPKKRIFRVMGHLFSHFSNSLSVIIGGLLKLSLITSKSLTPVTSTSALAVTASVRNI